MQEAGTRDRRRLAWLNEGAVLLALMKNQNRPTYVARIARLAPELTRSSKEPSRDPDKAARSKKSRKWGGTKPGMREAARRLHERGILARLDAVPPRRKTATPHYSIDPTIKTLSAISRTYGSWVVANMRRAGFSEPIIDKGMDGHLARILRAPLKDVREIPKAHKDELSYLARASTKALETFVDPGFELTPEVDGLTREQRLPLDFGRLKDAMHLAFIAEVASSPGLKIWEEGWDVEVAVETTVRSGGITMRLGAKYDSKKFERRPQKVDEVHAKKSAERDKRRARGAR